MRARLQTLLRPSTTHSLLRLPISRQAYPRFYSSSSAASPPMTPEELSIASLLSSSSSPLAPTTSLLVRDVSGGCGSMYAIEVATTKFKGLSLLQQQRLVTRTLGDKVKEWHGVQIRTSVPEEGDA